MLVLKSLTAVPVILGMIFLEITDTERYIQEQMDLLIVGIICLSQTIARIQLALQHMPMFKLQYLLVVILIPLLYMLGYTMLHDIIILLGLLIILEFPQLQLDK